jgi:hypothetical protein
VIWVLLKVLQVVKTSPFFHHDGELVLSVLVKEVLLTAGQNIIETFERDSQHPDIVDLEHGSKSLNHTFLNKNVKLHRIGTSCAVTECPNRLILDLYVVMLKNLNKLVHNANINTDLNLLLGTRCNVRENPAGFFSHSFFGVMHDLVQGIHKTAVDGHLGLIIIPRNNITNCPQTRNGNGHILMFQQLYHFGQ